MWGTGQEEMSSEHNIITLVDIMNLIEVCPEAMALGLLDAYFVLAYSLGDQTLLVQKEDVPANHPVESKEDVVRRLNVGGGDHTNVGGGDHTNVGGGDQGLALQEGALKLYY